MPTIKTELLEQMKCYREENHERIVERRHDYYIRHKAGICEKQRLYNAANRKRISDRKKSHYAKNKDEILARCREYAALNKDAIHARDFIRRKIRKATITNQPAEIINQLKNEYEIVKAQHPLSVKTKKETKNA